MDLNSVRRKCLMNIVEGRPVSEECTELGRMNLSNQATRKQENVGVHSLLIGESGSLWAMRLYVRSRHGYSSPIAAPMLVLHSV